MKVAIIYRALLQMDLQSYVVGGVEAYVIALYALCRDLGHQPVVFQLSDQPQRIERNGIQIVGVGHADAYPDPARVAAFLHAASEEWRQGEDSITISALDHFSVPATNPRSIVVQHGIEFDLPLPPVAERDSAAKRALRRVLESGPWGNRLLMRRFERISMRRSAHFRQLFDQVPYRVCVDHNYVNWYRTQPGYVGLDNYWVIPNFCSVMSPAAFDAKLAAGLGKRILFARRFYPYRGAGLMLEIAPQILAKHPDASFTFAGEGGLEGALRAFTATEPRAKVVRYDPGQGESVLREHDVTVIPSFGSEGTTLSVAEGMGAGCAVVATDVGGITNMILHGYNGILVRPNAQAVRAGIERVLGDPELHRSLVRRGFDVACQVHALDRWRERWAEVLATVAKRG